MREDIINDRERKKKRNEGKDGRQSGKRREESITIIAR